MALKQHMLGLLFLAASCSGASAVPGSAQENPDDRIIELGTLTCSLLGKREGATSGIGRDVICQFQPGDAGPEEVYVGALQGVGRADLLFGKGAMLLSVKAPASVTATPGMLSQSYGADAGASGSTPAPLVGDKNKQIVLQPLMEEVGRVAEGKTQPDAVIILVELTLRSTPA
jgi:hypothetical protein